jgi:hypothetical protein
MSFHFIASPAAVRDRLNATIPVAEFGQNHHAGSEELAITPCKDE